MVLRAGLEPATNSLKGYCSTIELPQQLGFSDSTLGVMSTQGTVHRYALSFAVAIYTVHI